MLTQSEYEQLGIQNIIFNPFIDDYDYTLSLQIVIELENNKRISSCIAYYDNDEPYIDYNYSVTIEEKLIITKILRDIYNNMIVKVIRAIHDSDICDKRNLQIDFANGELYANIRV